MYVLLHFLNHLHKSLLYSHVWRNSSDSESCPVTKGVLQVPFTDGSGRGWKDRHSIKEFPPQASLEANEADVSCLDTECHRRACSPAPWSVSRPRLALRTPVHHVEGKLSRSADTEALGAKVKSDGS